MRKVRYSGNCYEDNAKHLLFGIRKSKVDSFRLCHGIVINAIDKKPMGHCWIESKGVVIDKSNGLDVEMKMDLYYELGNIKKVYKYTVHEVRRKIVEFEHWGAWDYDPPR